MADFLVGCGIVLVAMLGFTALSMKLFGREPTIRVLGNLIDMLYQGFRALSSRLDSAAKAFFQADESPWQDKLDELEDRVQNLESDDESIDDALIEIQQTLAELSREMDLVRARRKVAAQQGIPVAAEAPE